MRRILPIFLLILSISAAYAAESSSAPHVYRITDYGAKNDASALATEAFQRAIAAAKVAGGGTIDVPRGKYISGPIELFSNMTLNVEAGAIVTFPVAPLPFVKSRYLGVEALVPAPLISGENVENVAVTGQGTLTTGDYAQWGKAYGAQPEIKDKSENANGPHWDSLLKALESGMHVTDADYRAAASELRPSFLCFTHAKNVLVEGIRVIGAPMFVVHLLYSQNATVRNVKIEAYPGPHANGIVVDSSRFVHISNCYIDTGDDGIVLKSGKDADGLRVNIPTEDVTITNCTVHHAHGAVVIGSETSGGIHNIVASNITAVGTEVGIRIKSRRGRGGVVENVRFDNWTMRDVGTGIVVSSYYIMGGEKDTVEESVSIRTPVFRNIAISNVTIEGAKQAVDIAGLPEMPIDGLRLTDTTGTSQKGLSALYTNYLELHSIAIEAVSGPVLHIESATNLEMDAITARHPPEDFPVIELKKTAGATLRDSLAYPGTGIFLSISPVGVGESLHLIHNNLLKAKSAIREERAD